MSSVEVDVELPLRMLTTAATTAVTSRLAYCIAEPYEVRLHFDGPAPVQWSFSRDLLYAGLDGDAGLGDVRIWPAEAAGQIFLRLSSPAGEAVFSAGEGVVRRFLARTEALVPAGQEGRWLALDERLADLFGPDAAGPAFGRAEDVG